MAQYGEARLSLNLSDSPGADWLCGRRQQHSRPLHLAIFAVFRTISARALQPCQQPKQLAASLRRL